MIEATYFSIEGDKMTGRLGRIGAVAIVAGSFLGCASGGETSVEDVVDSAEFELGWGSHPGFRNGHGDLHGHKGKRAECSLARVRV
jgi:hypothetical protein